MAYKDLMDTKQAAVRLGVSEQRVRQLCEAGDFGKKFAGRWMITEAELRRFKPRPTGRPKQKKT